MRLMAKQFSLLYSVNAPPEPRKRNIQMMSSQIDPKKEDFSIQTCYLAREVIHYILKEEGILLNGYASGSHRPSNQPCITRPEFKAAKEALQKACCFLKTHHRREVVELIGTLDTTDLQLNATFLRVVENMFDQREITWNLIVSLFLFASSLAARLYNEGQQQKIESIIAWLATYITQYLAQWILDHGGWVRP